MPDLMIDETNSVKKYSRSIDLFKAKLAMMEKKEKK